MRCRGSAKSQLFSGMPNLYCRRFRSSPFLDLLPDKTHAKVAKDAKDAKVRSCHTPKTPLFISLRLYERILMSFLAWICLFPGFIPLFTADPDAKGWQDAPMKQQDQPDQAKCEGKDQQGSTQAVHPAGVDQHHC